MKLSEDFICRQVCGETLVMPVGEKTKEFNGIFTLTETGAFLLNAVAEGADEATAAEKMAAEVGGGGGTGKQDTKEFLEMLLNYGILRE